MAETFVHRQGLVGIYAPDFELPGTDGEVYHLTRYRENFRALGVVFLCNNCPVVERYIGRLKQIQADFAAQGFTLIGLNSNSASIDAAQNMAQMRAFAAEHELNFPYIRDASQDVARGFRATTTPEAFLIDQDGIIRYHGAIDNQAESNEGENQPYFRRALSALLAGEPIAIAYTLPLGSPLTMTFAGSPDT